VVVGLVAVLLKWFVHNIQHQLKYVLERPGYNFMLYFLPLIGIVLTVVFVQLIMNGKLGRGIADIIYSISRRSGNIPPDNTYSHVATSAITVGFGGSVGLEAPIVVTGSALGSTIARLFMLSQKERIVLLACGAAAGIAAVFNTPVAGVLFAMEVLLAEFSIPTFIPVLIAAASGAIVSKLLGAEHLFYLVTQDWKMDALPFYLLFGIFCGLLSVYFMKMYFLTEKTFAGYKNVYGKAIVGGLIVGLLIFIFPPLYGEGYSSVANLFRGNSSGILGQSFFETMTQPYVLLLFVLGILLLKVFATAITISAGGNGGIFAPSLFLGAFTGFGFAHLFNVTNTKQLTEINFVAAGMAGLLSGIVHAPLTAIFLIAEVTGGYVLFVPLMIVSAVSYFISRAFEPYSIYTSKLAQRGIRLDDKEAVLLRNVNLGDIIEKNIISLKRDHSIRKVIDAFSVSSQSVYPVKNNKDELEGLVLIDDMKSLLFKPQQYDGVKVGEVMIKALYKILDTDEMTVVMDKFDNSGLWYLPVVDHQNKFIGLADKKKLLTLIREGLTSHSLQID
jgi:CIC family chloride channel protein